MSEVVPEGWEISTLKEVVFKVVDNRGKTPPVSKHGFKLLEVSCVRNDRKTVDSELTEKHVSKEIYENWFRNGHPKIGDTVVPTVGSIGEFAYVDKNEWCIAQNLVALRPSNLIESNFLYFQCCGKQVQKNISRILMGAVQPSLRVPHFLKTEFLLPPLPEQKKIASILTSVDEVIENTQKQIDKLQDLKKATMNELLTKGIGHTEFKDSELGRIPKSWEVKRLDEVAEKIWIGLVTTMTKYYVTEGVPLIRNSDIKEGGIDVNGLINLEKEFANKNEGRSVRKDDVVTVHTGDIGTSCVISAKLSGAQGFATLNSRLNREIMEPLYFCNYLNSEKFKLDAKKVVTGDGRDNLNLKDFVKLLIPTPQNLKEQGHISRTSQKFDSLISSKKQKLAQTQALKKSLMQDLLTGKKRVQVN